MRWRGVLVLLAVLTAGLSLGIGFKVLRLEQINGTLQRIVPAPDFRAGRAIYPYSLIPGGVRNSYELSESIKHDPVIAAYYRDVRTAAMFPLRLAIDTTGYVSYRVGNQIFWTRHLVQIKKGELVLTDGHTMIRGRCGNQILPAYLRPKAVPTTLDPNPPDIVFEIGYPPVMAIPPNQALMAEKLAPRLPATPAMPPSDAPPAFWPPFTPPVAWCCGGATQTGSPPPVPPGAGIVPPPVIPPLGGDTPTPPATATTPVVPVVPVPEPDTLVLAGCGLLAIGYFRKRHRN